MYQPANITAPDAIHKELELIQFFLEAQVRSDDAGAIADRFDSMAGYMARSGKLKADAEWHYNALVSSAIMTALKNGYEQKLSTSTVNKFVESEARNYRFLVTWADRVNRSCTHQLDALRSVIATMRAERYQSNYRQ